jgi:hypothetical protein
VPKSSSLILLKLSWAQKFKFDIDRAEPSSNFPSYQAMLAKRINQTCTKSAHSVGCETVLTTESDKLYYIYHYFNRFFGLAQLWTKLILLKEPSQAEPLVQTFEMIELGLLGKGLQITGDCKDMGSTDSSNGTGTFNNCWLN